MTTKEILTREYLMSRDINIIDHEDVKGIGDTLIVCQLELQYETKMIVRILAEPFMFLFRRRSRG